MQTSNVVQEWHTGMTPPESPTTETKSPRENSRKLWKIQESFDHFVNKNRPKPKVGFRKRECMEFFDDFDKNLIPLVMVIKLYHLSVLGTEMITKVYFTFNINAPFNLKHPFLSSQGVCFLCTRFINQISWLLWQSQITTSINVAAAYQGTQKILVSSILKSQPAIWPKIWMCTNIWVQIP